MKKLLTQIKDNLQELIKELQNPDAWASIQEKEKQLQAIERTLQKMQKGGLGIPTEMREVKLRLIKEIESDQEIQQVQSGLVELLLSSLEEMGYHIPMEEIKKTRKKQKRPNAKGRRISLKDLCEEGLLHNGMVLHHHGKDGHYEAHIKDGKMIVKKGHATLEFDNPSAAAVEVGGGNRNGWTFWVLNYHNRIVELNTVRKAYKKA